MINSLIHRFIFKIIYKNNKFVRIKNLITNKNNTKNALKKKENIIFIMICKLIQ